jgi:predicted AlkP superfamily phosphohydrolase/phosphomutase
MINYYVDPGSGFVFAQNTSLLWGIILGLLGGVLFTLRFFFRFFKKIIWVVLALVVFLIIGGLIMSATKISNNKKIIILGIDAMDPEITERLMQEGKLPNLYYMKTAGSYARLVTTIPSETAVVWTSFSTGLDPSGHGIFDFVMRDPKTYSLYLSLSDISTVNGKVNILTRKKGFDFWQSLSKNKIPSFIYFAPNTFPVESVRGRLVAGMGVPDITGTMGKYTFYTTKQLTPEDADTRGRIVRVKPENNTVLTQLYGPRFVSNNLEKESTVPLKISLKPKEASVCLEFQQNRIVLKKDNWSPWYQIQFKLSLFRDIRGIMRFYLKSVSPDFELYVSPINFDPQNPVFSISYPADYSKQLVKKYGLYYTQGMPHDTWALTENKLDENAFLELTDEIFRERQNILKGELHSFKSGLFFFYFDILDAIQHMFWRYQDKQHPLYEPDSTYKQTIVEYYQKIDQLVGDLLKDLDKDTTLIVLSDHGFGPFRRSVHLNRWLLENGYLSLKKGAQESQEFFQEIDWSKTKAYALGFGGIYLNRLGREHYGIVKESEVGALRQNIIDGLKQFRDPANGQDIVKDVYIADQIYNGDYVNDAPDLYVGFNKGYRASWQTALGCVPKSLIEDNKKKWSGDHLIDPQLVPGVIFVNKNYTLKDPRIIDIAPTVLGLFGIDKPEQMQGKKLF